MLTSRPQKGQKEHILSQNVDNHQSKKPFSSFQPCDYTIKIGVVILLKKGECRVFRFCE